MTDTDIAVLVGPGCVIFGVAGRGGEVCPRDIEKAFGTDLGKLRATVKSTMGDLSKAGAVRIADADLQALVDTAGLGSLERGAGAAGF